MITNGEKIALAAMKKEYKSLTRKLVTAKKKTQDCIGAASKIMEARLAASEILKGNHSHSELSKLIEPLAKQEKEAIKAGKQNLIKLMDREHELEFAVSDLATEISRIEFRQ